MNDKWLMSEEREVLEITKNICHTERREVSHGKRNSTKTVAERSRSVSGNNKPIPQKFKKTLEVCKIEKYFIPCKGI